MAKTHGSVRMGPISLFTLVIILCLAVMAVLTITTAYASYNLTARQADAVSLLYHNETAAQRFLSLLDNKLATEGKTDGFTTSDLADSLEAMVEETVSACVAEGHEGIEVTAEWQTPEDACATAGVNEASLKEELVGAVYATFTSQDGRTLQAVIGVRSNATYRLLSWKVVSIWTDEGAGETLWMG